MTAVFCAAYPRKNVNPRRGNKTRNALPVALEKNYKGLFRIFHLTEKN